MINEEEFKKEIENLILAHIDKEHFDIEFGNEGYHHVYEYYPYIKLRISDAIINNAREKHYGTIVLNLDPILMFGTTVHYEGPFDSCIAEDDKYETVKFIVLSICRKSQQFLYEMSKVIDADDAIINMNRNKAYYDYDAAKYAIHFLKDSNIEFDNLAV